MQIKMLGTHRISEDAHTIRVLEKDKVYDDIAHTAACGILQNGWGVRVDKPFHPQPTPPCNPATLEAMGVNLDGVGTDVVGEI